MPTNGAPGEPAPPADALSPASYLEDTGPQPVVAPRPAGRRLGTFRALRHRNYRLYFSGQLVSLTGSWVQTTALMWLAFNLTQESKWPALISALQVVPTCFLGVWGGSLAGRWPRRRLIMTTQALLMSNALLLAGLVLTGTVAPWHLVAIAAASGLVNAVDLPARLSFVIDMVGRDDLLNAVALNSLTFNLARALGPAVGAVLLSLLGPGPCFLLNGLSYLAVLLALARMQVVIPGSGPEVGSAGGSVRAAFGYLAGKPRLALLLVMVAVMSFFGWPVLSLLPALAQHHLEVEGLVSWLPPLLADQRLGPEKIGYGLLLSGVGGGALLAALTIASFGTLARSRRFIGTGTVLTASALVLLSQVRSLPLAVACCAVIGYGLILFMATGQAVMQLGAADHIRGPIMGIWSMVLSGAQPLGNLLLGPAADRLGEPTVLRLQGLGCATGALVVLGLLVVWTYRRPDGPRPLSG